MTRHYRQGFALILLLLSALAVPGIVPAARGADELTPAEQVRRAWFEIRTPHLNVYGCGEAAEVINVTSKLEQFRNAYAQLAGAQAIASPPIIVVAFPDVETMKPFLPLYDGKPMNVNGLFHHGKDENLILLGLSASNSETAQIIFHEYTHLLLRRNDNIWPLWLKEGMAEIYSQFDMSGRGVRIGGPIDRHLSWLKTRPLTPLKDLFAVSNDSPDYNERGRQGMFYAQSWLLTEYLMLGDNPSVKSRFGQLTVLLKQGQPLEAAFTNAFHMSLDAMDAAIQQYLDRGNFESLGFVLNNFVVGTADMTPRTMSPVETCYHLGDELLHVGRLDAAEAYFIEGRKIAPASPLPYAGLGLAAAMRGDLGEARRQFAEATRRGPMGFLPHYIYAESQLRAAADSRDGLAHLDPGVAAAASGELQKSIAMMPDFGPAHYLLGCVEMASGGDLAAAESQLQRAVQLEPENRRYPQALAEIERLRHSPSAQ